MNDNVDENFLRNLLQKCGPTEEQIIYRHPRTQRRLGIARIVFVDVKSARLCIEKYNHQSVMGNVMNVFHDAFGEQCKQILLEASGEKKPQKPVVPPQPPTNPTVNQQLPPLPNFKQKDELTPHPNESADNYYQMDYNNPYGRSGYIPTDHKQEEHDWNDSREKYDEYGYEADDHRHYRYDKKDSRRWDSKSSRYYKNEKERERRPERRDYRGHRDERDRESNRRRDYDYDRKDRESRDNRDRRERDHRNRDSKYRDYKKSDRDYPPSADGSFSYSSSTYVTSSHHHSSHHYSTFESSSTSSSFHQYPPLPYAKTRLYYFFHTILINFFF